VTLGLASGGLGCAHQKDLALASKEQPSPNQIISEQDQPKHDPKPATCVALGTFSEQCAADARRTQAEKQALLEQARKAYQQALRLDSNDVKAQTALARLYVKMEDYEHALATYQLAVHNHPKDAGLHYELGMCQARLKQWQPALDNLNYAVQLDPENRLYTHSLGYALARCGRYDESFALFAKQEGEASAHYNVARMLHHNNQDELSKQHLRLALQLKPELAPARELLASLEAPASTRPSTTVPN
jgi:tetratricopeptide (TPR) repeat protein